MDEASDGSITMNEVGESCWHLLFPVMHKLPCTHQTRDTTDETIQASDTTDETFISLGTRDERRNI